MNMPEIKRAKTNCQFLSTGRYWAMAENAELTEYLKNLTFVAFDTETTGLWAPSNRIVEIGAVRFDLVTTESTIFKRLVNPERPIPPEVIRIHRITDDMVADEPTIEPVMNEFIEFCGPDSVLVAHNAPFDIAFVGCELDRVGMKFGDNPIIDTVEIYRTLYPRLESYSLLSLARKFDLAASQSHRALEDALLVAGLIRNIRKALPEINSREEFERTLTCFHISDWHTQPEQIPDEFKIVHEAQQSGSRLQIVYSSPDKPDHSRTVRVRNIFQLGMKFYMNAYCERVHAERTFRLDRIRSAELVAGEDVGSDE